MGCSYPGLVLLPDTGKDPLRAGEADGAGGRWWPGESRPVHDHGGCPPAGGCIPDRKILDVSWACGSAGGAGCWLAG